MTTSDWWQAECARLRVELEATERARREAEEERDAALELVAPDAVEAARLRDDRDAARLAALVTARVALADAELILEERERQLTEALTAVAEERARCAAVCREVAQFYDPPDVGSVVARACADEIERECVSALLRSPGA
jgi:membrane protein involved in colicin uptake